MANKFERTFDGFIPRFVLDDVAVRNPGLYAPTLSLVTTQRLWNGSAARLGNLHRFTDKALGDKLNRQIFDAEGRESLPGKRARFENDPPATLTDVNNSYDFFGQMDRYYRAVHNRNSYDANGAAWKGVVNYGVDYDNAFWDGSNMVAGTGDKVIFRTFVDLNVWAHELAHAVTEYAVPGGIDYYGQPGAINEHMSDVGACNVESWGLGVLPSQYHWLIGKEIFVPLKPSDSQNGKYHRTALRNMLYPGTGYNDPSIGKDRQPADMDAYVKTSGDNGGVHINSGIPNRLYALFTRGIETAGLGHDWDSTFGRAARIWYAARPDLGNRPPFAKLAYFVREACAVEKTEEKKLREILDKALAAVKLSPNKAAVDDLTPEDVAA